MELPFATPVPLPLTAGGTIAVVDTGEWPRAAALFRWIPGENPDDGDVSGIAVAGGALARLDVALATVRTTLPAPAFEGDMTRVHPAVTDLASLPELDLEARQYVARAAELAGERIPRSPVSSCMATSPSATCCSMAVGSRACSISSSLAKMSGRSSSRTR